MAIRGIQWLGTRTENVAGMRSLLVDVLGLEPSVDEDQFVVVPLPNGDLIELFGPDEPEHQHFTTGPVAGLLVDDLASTAADLRAAGIELLGDTATDPESGAQWLHFRAPDGNVYEITERPDLS